MRVCLCTLAILLAASQFAYAKQVEQIGFKGSKWEKVPTGRDFERVYPKSAASRDVSGFGVLCCAPRDDGTLACTLGAEGPENEGFGAAALELSKKFRMPLNDVTGFRKDAANFVYLPIMFFMNTGGDQRGRDRYTRMVREATKGVCMRSTPVS